MKSDSSKPKIAFICTHNSCRSQMAEALCRKYAGDILESYSAGTDIADKVNPDAVRIMMQLYGIDMQTQQPKRLADLPPVDIVITMGCGVQCPVLPCSRREDWGLDDPTGKGDAAFEKTAKEIERKIQALKESIKLSSK
ncbi:MAG: arsenate reductase ArsC [Butyrivibrio sp.]|nr:arsenate reductase ArsC [Butyrivibrio sp.]